MRNFVLDEVVSAAAEVLPGWPVRRAWLVERPGLLYLFCDIPGGGAFDPGVRMGIELEMREAGSPPVEVLDAPYGIRLGSGVLRSFGRGDRKPWLVYASAERGVDAANLLMAGKEADMRMDVDVAPAVREAFGRGDRVQMNARVTPAVRDAVAARARALSTPGRSASIGDAIEDLCGPRDDGPVTGVSYSFPGIPSGEGARDWARGMVAEHGREGSALMGALAQSGDMVETVSTFPHSVLTSLGGVDTPVAWFEPEDVEPCPPGVSYYEPVALIRPHTHVFNSLFEFASKALPGPGSWFDGRAQDRQALDGAVAHLVAGWFFRMTANIQTISVSYDEDGEMHVSFED